MRIVTRSEWGARPPESRSTITLPSRELWFHHFATDGWHGPSGMRRCQDFHMDTKGWADIGYTHCVDNADGTIYEGRGPGIRGAHTEGHNTIGHAICVMANLDATPLSRAALESCARLAEHGKRHGWWGDWTGGHREASGAQTACPGRYGMAALPDLRALTDQYSRTPTTAPAPTPTTEDDMRLLHPHQTDGDKGGIWLLIGDNVGRVADPDEMKAIQKLRDVPLERIDNPGWQCIKRVAKLDSATVTANIDPAVAKAVVDEFNRRLAQ